MIRNNGKYANHHAAIYLRAAAALIVAQLAACATPDTVPTTIDGSYSAADIAACRNLILLPTLTITYADVVDRYMGVPAHCYVKGVISNSINWHAMLPAPDKWSGRLVHQGDGGSDGNLDAKPDPYTRNWVSLGDVVANSNSGHDIGTGPNWAYNNRQAEHDFGYRAVHLTVHATKTLTEVYYGRPAEYSYHVGCSNGGRQGLAAAQKFPYDFDGIVVGAPSINRARNFYHHLKLMQHLYRDDLAANPAHDTDGNGLPDSLIKIDRLHNAVLARCDAIDGIVDRIIDDPGSCDFDVGRYLKANQCEDGTDNAECYTAAQAAFIRHMYTGSYDDAGKLIYPGLQLGSEHIWYRFLPQEENQMMSYILQSVIRVFQSVYDEDPGVAPADVSDTSQTVYETGSVPEWAWWAEDPQRVLTASRELEKIIDATDPDLTRFLVDHGGKLLIYQGWDEPYHSAVLLLDYYQQVIDKTFDSNPALAQQSVRLFMMPGVQHCIWGTGPDRWDRFQVMKDWIEDGKAPDSITAQHMTWDVPDNERLLCPYPQRAFYVGPENGENMAQNWIADNFECREPDQAPRLAVSE